MNNKEIKTALLIVIFIGLPVSFVIGSWYWTSQTITHTITVSGSIDATTNFNPLTALTDGETWTPYGDIVTIDTLIEGTGIGLPVGHYMFLVVDTANTNTLTLQVNVDCTPSVTCEVALQGITLAGLFGGAVDLGEIATDGSEAVTLTDGLDPLWLLHSTTSQRVLRLRFVFASGGLGVGEYPVEVVVSLGN